MEEQLQRKPCGNTGSNSNGIIYELHDAVRSGSIEQCQKIIGSGVNVNLPDSKRRTALHIAAWKGNSDLVKCLVSAKCDPLAKALDGFTALHFAAASGDVKCCLILISKQKSLLSMRITKGNKTALHLAISKGHIEVVKCLLDNGADITAKTGAGKTVLELASDYTSSSTTLEATRMANINSNTSDGSIAAGVNDMYGYIKEKYENYIDNKRNNDKVGDKRSAPIPASVHGTIGSAGVPTASTFTEADNSSIGHNSTGTTNLSVSGPISVPVPPVAVPDDNGNQISIQKPIDANTNTNTKIPSTNPNTNPNPNPSNTHTNTNPNPSKPKPKPNPNPKKRKVIMAHLEFDEE